MSENQLAYWKQQLRGASALLELPTDKPRPAVQTLQTGTVQFQLDAELSQQLKALSQNSGSTLFTILLSAYAVLLHRYSYAEDIVIGSPVANRNHQEVEPLTYALVNTVLLRIKPIGNLNFLQLLQQVRQVALDAYEHRNLPFEKLLEELAPERSLSYHPLFQVMFVLQNSPAQRLNLFELTAQPIISEQSTAKFDLTLSMQDNEQGLNGAWEYSYDLFETETIQRLSGHFKNLLVGIIAQPENPISQLPLMSPAERNQLLVSCHNNTSTDYSKNKCIHQLFEEQAERTPDHIAVVFEAEQLTYAELNAQANQLARHLQAQGTGPNALVGICVPRSPLMIISLISILKVGAAYVPIDPEYPAERQQYMVTDSGIDLLLYSTHNQETDLYTSAPRMSLEDTWPALTEYSADNLQIDVSGEQLAYVIYTSGSTGRPKGVQIKHQGLSNYLSHACANYYEKAQGGVVSSPLAFDATITSLLGPLYCGKTVVLLPPYRNEIESIIGHIKTASEVWVFKVTPAHIEAISQLVGSACLSHLSHVVVVGGEQFTAQAAHYFKETLLPAAVLVNEYGPTETVVGCSTYEVKKYQDIPKNRLFIPIGKPIQNTQLYVLSLTQQLCPIGVPGELFIGGYGVAQGYHQRLDLSKIKFVDNPFEPSEKLYRTGDKVQWLPNGNLEFLGRVDDQIKLRGFRIEPGEVEAAINNHPAIQQSLVMAREDTPGDKRLVAYTVQIPEADVPLGDLRTFLKSRLPDYMMPSALVTLDALPLTPSGKVDRKVLPPPKNTSAATFVPAEGEVEATLARIWGEVLGVFQVSRHDNFFDIGGTSLLGMKVVARIQQQLCPEFRVVKLYEHPTVAALAGYLAAGEPAALTSPTVAAAPSQEGIAIVGMAGRFPGAESVDRFWQNLCDGVESHTVFRLEELDPSIPAELRNDPSYVPVRGIVDKADQFDAAFFGISPREAEVMDPQARVFLEVVYAALENAGYSPDTPDTTIGLYAGSGHNTYFARHLCGRPEIINRLGEFQVMLANEKDFVTTRAAYKLNLQGPVVSVNTACSTSLVAVIQAFQALRDRHCDLALAGGISITTPQASGYLYQEGSMLSGDGHCRPFDTDAQGTLFNDGAAVVALKRLSDAQRDGDRIYAVIHGTGMNNDGADKVSFTAPSVIGQAKAIAAAQAEAGFAPDTIQYVETHGTATPLGDPIEVEALTQAFHRQTEAKQFCAIGSVKSNVGHLVAAAGVTGLIKTALALYHRHLPASLHFQRPNPHIDFANSPFYVQAQATDWPQGDRPRRAGVSSFGVGGTNAHVVLEEAPAPVCSSPARPYHLLLLSAKTPTALDQASRNLQAHLTAHPDLPLADVAHTLQRGRRVYGHRRWWVCRQGEAAAALAQPDPNHSGGRQGDRRQRDVVFMFPGQGSQYLHMGANLYAHEPVFREALDTCAALLLPVVERDIRELIYPEQDEAAAIEQLTRTQWTQPALFAVEYALAHLWQSWGVQPTALIGHSIGEFVAACLAGVLPLEATLKLVALRGRLMDALPTGAMLSVRAEAAAVEPYVGDGVAIAAINAPGLCVVSGPHEAIAACQARLEAADIPCRALHTSHAFHSPMMAPVRQPLLDLLQDVPLTAPQIPIVSTVTGDWLTDAQAMDPAYWADQALATVRFADGIATLWQQPERILLEVGPRTTAATLARRQIQDPQQQLALSSLGTTAEDGAEWQALWGAVGRLWAAGVDINWAQVYQHERRDRLPLPTYPFERQRYWIDPLPARDVSEAPSLNELPPSPPAPLPLSSLSLPHSPNPPLLAMPQSRQPQILAAIHEVLEESSGLELAGADPTLTFLDLGLDSLSLTQVGIALKKKVGVKITFRQLLEDFPTLDALTNHLDAVLPAEAFAPPPAAEAATPAVATPTALAPTPMAANGNGHNGNGHAHSNGQLIPMTVTPPPSDAVQALVAQQLQIMQQQLALLGQGTPASPLPTSPPPAAPASENSVPAAPPINGNGRPQSTPAISPSPNPAGTGAAPKKTHGPGARIEKSKNTDLSTEQRAALDRFIARYTTRTQESKRQAQAHRRPLADPRTVSGFSPLLKEIVYPIATDRSAGSKLWDVDGNEYVDLTNGFGLNFFGWSPDFVKQAVMAQMDKGIEIGPQTPLAGRVAQMVSEFTGMERVAFCNTGSEAVMAALRLSRTVTGRNRVAIFNGAYHGTFDEVIVRGGPKHRSFPGAPGIMASAVENVLMLDYGTPESLEVLRSQADDLAAILVEPVQSRRPELQPKAFLQDLRRLTEQAGTAFIVDEVVTGFRVHPGGAQAYFNIQADLATYGKVIGGGLPIGVIAGKAEYMDALDGGFWQFGDESIPEVGVTFFAGTFVRHPMALAAAEAVLTKLKELGPEAQRSLADKVTRFATHLNDHFQRVQAPVKIAHFTSLFNVKYDESESYGGLLFYLLREKGVHVWEHRPCFFTLAHTNADIEFVIRAFKDSVAELQIAGFLSGAPPATAQTVAGNGTANRNRPPQPGARLGKDPQGNPAWYIPDPDRPGKYLQVGAVS
jgi:amino acid adenylation domain-containing protein